jgi:hypothetical protein
MKKSFKVLNFEKWEIKLRKVMMGWWGTWWNEGVATKKDISWPYLGLEREGEKKRKKRSYMIVFKLYEQNGSYFGNACDNETHMDECKLNVHIMVRRG